MARWVRPALLVALIAGGAIVAATVGVPPLTEIQAWVAAAGWAGPVLYASIFAVASLTPGPATLLTVGAGVLFGWSLGVPVALAGSLTAATIGFTLARVLGRATVRGLAGERLERIDAALRRRGVLAVIGIRLVPLAPFAMVNTACGLSGVRTRDYLLGTLVGLVPGTVTFVAVGAFGTSPGSIPFLITAVGLVLLVGGAAVAARRGLSAAGAGGRHRSPASTPDTAVDLDPAVDHRE
jgi:uncharacterized membrane protein YdjX (TVP38/TMEM64 family)